MVTFATEVLGAFKPRTKSVDGLVHFSKGAGVAKVKLKLRPD
jgi:hypothetical protein